MIRLRSTLRFAADLGAVLTVYVAGAAEDAVQRLLAGSGLSLPRKATPWDAGSHEACPTEKDATS